MAFRLIELPGPITLVPGPKLEGQVRRQARDHPHLPVDPLEMLADLNSRPEGVPATLSEPFRGGDWSLLLYGRSFVARVFPTKRYSDGYVVAAVNPLRMADHHRLAGGCLMLRPAAWRQAYELRAIPPGSQSYWPVLVSAWDQLNEGLAEEHGAPPLSVEQTGFLDRLDSMIEARRRIEAETAKSSPGFPYTDIKPTGERRHGTHALYVFRLVGGAAPDRGAFVQVRGEPEQRGQVTWVDGRSVTIRFDQPVDWARLSRQGELEVTASEVVFNKQREAVARLRTRGSRNTDLLSVVVDHRVRGLRRTTAEPTVALDRDQRQAFEKALGVRDMLIVLGPPGTGKTRTISQIAGACAKTAEPGPVLITAHTNRAVDNVLERLPKDLLALRVGHEGSVTAEGLPYLLERQAADLRKEITKSIEASLAAYEDIEHATHWAGELDSRIGALTSAEAAYEKAGSKLAEVRRTVGGDAQVHVDELTERSQRRSHRLGRAERRVERLTRRRAKAAAGEKLPLLGFLLALIATWYAKRLVTCRKQTQALQEELAATVAELAEAERALELATRDDPGVVAARTALEAARDQRAEYRTAVLAAARTVSAAVAGVETPPSVGAGQSAESGDGLEAELKGLSEWLGHRLPLFVARAGLLADWHTEVSGASDQLHPELIRYADVIAATCIGAASRPELSDVEFDLAIVDEAGQVGLPDALVPLTRARRAVLVGDHQQLPPFLDTEVKKWGKSVGDPVVRTLLSQSALELLVHGLPDSHVVRLTRQRRMPAAIADFISVSFYENTLRTSVEREHHDPLFRSPLAFVDTARLPADRRHESSGRRGTEHWGQRGFSNTCEAELLVELTLFYHRLHHRYQRRATDWAVIVPYRAQVTQIADALARELGDAETVRLNVGTVDSFQGGERDVILYGFTRSNSGGEVGFLKELRRANVAFTRAKRQLVLVGDMSTLISARDRGFRELSKSLRAHLAEHGDIRQYDQIRQKLADPSS